MIRDVPSETPEATSSVNPLLDAVLKLKNQRFSHSSQSLNHSLYRTFGPPLEAISGVEITLSPPPKRRKKLPESKEDLPDHIQGEVAQLNSKFKVSLDSSQIPILPLDSIQLHCFLEDRDLPSVPPISVTLGPNYPQESSPELHDNCEEYDTSTFLKAVRQALASRVKKLPARHTLTQLLTAWEMAVRSACSFKKRPGENNVVMLQEVASSV